MLGGFERKYIQDLKKLNRQQKQRDLRKKYIE